MPTGAKGRKFVGAKSEVDMYGLLAPARYPDDGLMLDFRLEDEYGARDARDM